MPAANVQNFDGGWKFRLGDSPGAEAAGFEDLGWRTVDVPHDWSIEGDFNKQAPAGQGGAFLPAGIGWYRKSFRLAQSDSGNRVFIDFDGVMANSDVWVNGFHLGKRPYGYVSFRYDLTGHLNFGAKGNVIAVRADNSRQPASRYYTGAGINRHVRLVVSNPVHVAHWSTFVTTPRVSAAAATVHVKTEVVNESASARAVTVAIEVAGKKVTAVQRLSAGERAVVERDVEVQSPRRWNLDDPQMYDAAVRISEGGQVVDSEQVPFGIREYHFDADTGFWLNGKNFKIKGVCLHADASALGTAVPIRAWRRRLEALRQIGVNAIRTAHNPVSPDFLDLADRMGFLVMTEMFDVWTVAKNPYDYHLDFRDWSVIDTRDTVMRDRNHPSIILYSAGNEIHDTPKADLAKEILASLVKTFHEADPTRPVTQALFRPNVSHDYDNGLADMLDVIGQNYRENEILAAHNAKKTRKIIGTENGHLRKAWLPMRDHPAYSGQFLWAGIDYLGEGRIWPIISGSFGLLDRTGALKPLGMERQSWWSEKPVVHIVRRVGQGERQATDPGYEPDPTVGRLSYPLRNDWTPANLGLHDENVEVYSNCASVELLGNGRSLGVKSLPADASARTWRVPFEAGTIRAACGDGKTFEELQTAGKAARIVLSADRPTITNAWDDVVYITAKVVDANGVLVPGASDKITFSVTGPGKLLATDNGDNTSLEPFLGSTRSAFFGSCVGIVRATQGTGAMQVTASASGLIAGETKLSLLPKPLR